MGSEYHAAVKGSEVGSGTWSSVKGQGSLRSIKTVAAASTAFVCGSLAGEFKGLRVRVPTVVINGHRYDLGIRAGSVSEHQQRRSILGKG